MTKSRGEIANFVASAILLNENRKYPFMAHECIDIFMKPF